MNRKKCHIIYSLDDNYVPYMCVSLLSLIGNCNSEQLYEVDILYDKLSKESIKDIKRIIDKEVNISLRLISVAEYFDELSLFVGADGNDNYLSMATYYRLIAHVLIPDADQAVYLDCDTIICGDIWKLCCVDLGDHLFAGAPDVCDNYKCIIPNSDLRKYRMQELGMKTEDMKRYINAGVLVINLHQIRILYPSDSLLKIAQSKKWKKHDQDVINYIGCNRIMLLPLEWNAIEPIGEYLLNFDPDNYGKLQKALAKPLIMHYASRKPWKELDVTNRELFWHYAVQYSGGERIILDFLDSVGCNTSNLLKLLDKGIAEGKVSAASVMKHFIKVFMERLGK